MTKEEQLAEQTDQIRKITASMRDKLKSAWEGGPGSPDVVLTPAEATLAYRLIVEGLAGR